MSASGAAEANRKCVNRPRQECWARSPGPLPFQTTGKARRRNFSCRNTAPCSPACWNPGSLSGGTPWKNAIRGMKPIRCLAIAASFLLESGWYIALVVLHRGPNKTNIFSLWLVARPNLAKNVRFQIFTVLWLIMWLKISIFCLHEARKVFLGCTKFCKLRFILLFFFLYSFFFFRLVTWLVRGTWRMAESTQGFFLSFQSDIFPCPVLSPVP